MLLGRRPWQAVAIGASRDDATLSVRTLDSLRWSVSRSAPSSLPCLFGHPVPASTGRRPFSFRPFSTRSRSRSPSTPSRFTPSHAHGRRDFLLRVLEAGPSQREALNFLRRYDLLQPSSFSSTQTTTNTPVALLKVTMPLRPVSARTFVSTLLQLQTLGIYPIVLVDHELARDIDWSSSLDLHALRHALNKERIQLAEYLEHAGGRIAMVEDLLDGTPPPAVGSQVPSYPQQLQCAAYPQLQHAIAKEKIPLLLPTAIDRESIRVTPVPANRAFEAVIQGIVAPNQASLVPKRLVFFTQQGGLVDDKRQPLPFVNLADEYAALVGRKNLSASRRDDLETLYRSLSHLHPSAAAIVTSPDSSFHLLHNLITDKPPSFQEDLLQLEERQAKGSSFKTTASTTILRQGISIQTFTDLQQLDIPRMNALLESSFGQPLEQEYWKRLLESPGHGSTPPGENGIAAILVAGDYLGAAVLTRNVPAGGSLKSLEVVYLDKFAVSPQTQGMGIADMLWKVMRDRYDMVWRSRVENGVNKWYFERSDGHVKLGKWVLFWTGEDGFEDVELYRQCVEAIPATFRRRDTKDS